MVSSVTNCSRNGLSDWLLQRVSALLIGAYSLFLFLTVALHAPLSFSAWSHLFHSAWMKVSTLGVVLMIVIHAWVGMWTIFTDYIKCSRLRLLLEVLLALALLGLLLWTIVILWS